VAHLPFGDDLGAAPFEVDGQVGHQAVAGDPPLTRMRAAGLVERDTVRLGVPWSSVARTRMVWSPGRASHWKDQRTQAKATLGSDSQARAHVRPSSRLYSTRAILPVLTNATPSARGFLLVELTPEGRLEAAKAALGLALALRRKDVEGVEALLGPVDPRRGPPSASSRRRF
jgi:hypothetical protein